MTLRSAFPTRRAAAAVALVAALISSATACQEPATLWGPCTPEGSDTSGHDGTYVLSCENGRWRPVMTLAEFARKARGEQFTIAPLPTSPTTTAATTGNTTSTTTTTAPAPPASPAYIKATNTDILDRFGEAVAISGDTMVVGAPKEDSDATDVGGDQADDSLSDSGAVYVYVRQGGVWTPQAYLKATNTDAGDEFGTSVDIDGDTIVVGAPGEDSAADGVGGDQDDDGASGAGAAYVYTRTAGTWTPQAYLKATNSEDFDSFGVDVAVSGDTVVVGAFDEDSSATDVGGDQTDNSAMSSGAAYVYLRTAGTWAPQARLATANPRTFGFFGHSVAISGETIVVGSIGEASSATGVGGDPTDTSATSSGAAFVFLRSGGTWSAQAYLKATNTGAVDLFGSSVAIDGDTIVVGATGEGSAATGVGGDQSDNSLSEAGAAYVYLRSAGTWAPQAYVKATNTGSPDRFGGAVAVSGETAAIGAYLESSNATGVGGNQGDDSAGLSGAAYVYSRTSGTWGG